MPYTINGSSASISSEPRLEEGTMWVPVRGIAEALGASVEFEPTNGVVVLTRGEDIVTITIGDASVDVNGTSHTLQSTPFVEDGETWVPVRFFNDALGAAVGVDLQNNSVDISGGNNTQTV